MCLTLGRIHFRVSRTSSTKQSYHDASESVHRKNEKIWSREKEAGSDTNMADSHSWLTSGRERSQARKVKPACPRLGTRMSKTSTFAGKLFLAMDANFIRSETSAKKTVHSSVGIVRSP